MISETSFLTADLVSIIGFVIVILSISKIRHKIKSALFDLRDDSLIERLQKCTKDKIAIEASLSITTSNCTNKIENQLKREKQIVANLNSLLDKKRSVAAKEIEIHRKWLTSSSRKKESALTKIEAENFAKLIINEAMIRSSKVVDKN